MYHLFVSWDEESWNGNPWHADIRSGDPTAIKKASAAWRHVHLNKVLETADQWLPAVRRMRPRHKWEDVCSVLRGKGKREWHPDVLRRTVQRLVKEELAEPELMERSPRKSDSERLVSMVTSIAMADPDLSVREIAKQVERVRERTPLGRTTWSPSSVGSLLERAASIGYEVPNRAER